MSNTLSQIEQTELDELRRAFGEIEGEPEIDADQRESAAFLAHIRGLLAEATHEEKASVSTLAKLLGISKAAVSHHLRSEGDIRASTMWSFAKALNRRWKIDLVPVTQPVYPGRNFFSIRGAQASSSSLGNLVGPRVAVAESFSSEQSGRCLPVATTA
jgi:DNA-binding transcriptional ArsR family regulator